MRFCFLSSPSSSLRDSGVIELTSDYTPYGNTGDVFLLTGPSGQGETGSIILSIGYSQAEKGGHISLISSNLSHSEAVGRSISLSSGANGLSTTGDVYLITHLRHLQGK